MEIGRRSSSHHVQRRLGHVGVRMLGGLARSIELPLHRGYVHHVFVVARCRLHQRFEPSVQDERRNCVHQLRLQQLHRGNLVQLQSPRISTTQVDLLQVLVELAGREQRVAVTRRPILGEQDRLRHFGRAGDRRVTSRCRGIGRSAVGRT